MLTLFIKIKAQQFLSSGKLYRPVATGDKACAKLADFSKWNAHMTL